MLHITHIVQQFSILAKRDECKALASRFWAKKRFVDEKIDLFKCRY